MGRHGPAIAHVTTPLNRYGTPDQSYPDYETLATLAEITRRLKAARKALSMRRRYPR